MICGWVSPISTRLTFEELAVLFEGEHNQRCGTSLPQSRGEHLACLLAKAGVLHIIRLKRKSQTKRKKKITAAVYLYQVDNDGEWGEISFDFEAGTAEIVQLAEWDTMISKAFAQKAIRHIIGHEENRISRLTMYSFRFTMSFTKGYLPPCNI